MSLLSLQVLGLVSHFLMLSLRSSSRVAHWRALLFGVFMSALHIRFGINPTDILDLHHDGDLEVLEQTEEKGQAITSARLTNWSFVLVRTVERQKRKRRLRLIQPKQGQELELRHFEFFVEGEAEVVATLNNGRRADEVWTQRDTIDWAGLEAFPS